MRLLRVLVLVAFLLHLTPSVHAQSAGQPDNTQIAKLVNEFKKDARGPYKDIRWFCKDGTTLPPAERCPEPGVQRARYKDAVISLAQTNHVFLGQILSTTNRQDFWDNGNRNSRLKQYQLEKYLREIDNGWINRRAQSYRGAFQSEDEDAWGISFLNWLVQDVNVLESQFFLIRQASKSIPHRADDNLSQRIRTSSKEVSDTFPTFMDIRVKIHGQPDASDADRVRDFLAANRPALGPDLAAKLESLARDLDMLFGQANIDVLNQFVSSMRQGTIRTWLSEVANSLNGGQDPIERALVLSDASLTLREMIVEEADNTGRLTLLDLSVKLEELLIANLSSWKASTLEEEFARIELLTTAAAGYGFLELWEYDAALSDLERLRGSDRILLRQVKEYLDLSRRLVEWGALTVNFTYSDVITLYAGFEPLAAGYTDELVRSSVLLAFGASVGSLGDFVAREAGFSNRLFDISNQGQARGLNPGYATGTLRVIPGDAELVEIDPSAIYVFNRPPADLKPVAGILTVTEGNMVSHVQLLARNLGIPNGVVSAANLNDLQKYNGQTAFLAVSNNGTVLLKAATQMTAQEKKLFEVKVRAEEKVTVPTQRIDLGVTSTLDLSKIDARTSGVLSGPKAANLGQLKKMFPDNVVDGIVIPFGVFREHMDQQIPGGEGSYWSFLQATFQTAESMRRADRPEQAVETYILGRLEKMRQDIKAMRLLPDFEKSLSQDFNRILGSPLGTVPVFLRSDTNMEDLKDFTGAGLNLTLFNVLDRERILQGIKDVWASPYTERSFKWRQSYLLNPENVYPSILIIPSVDADYSGVLITTGLEGGNQEDATVAFNRGVGGAVDGQAAETWLLKRDRGNNQLLSPSREPTYTAIPATGGTRRVPVLANDRILTDENLEALRQLGAVVEQKLPKVEGVDTKGPFDVELGFRDDKIWLFQVRPFVENKQALSSEYLQQISPSIPQSKSLPLSTSL
ncbi:MAG: phosphoenolpyruvate synthase [Rhodothermales bacterium]|nr:phosphoenolpyruvate synthase [Rhodothermales bacterium]